MLLVATGCVDQPDEQDVQASEQDVLAARLAELDTTPLYVEDTFLDLQADVIDPWVQPASIDTLEAEDPFELDEQAWQSFVERGALSGPFPAELDTVPYERIAPCRPPGLADRELVVAYTRVGLDNRLEHALVIECIAVVNADPEFDPMGCTFLSLGAANGTWQTDGNYELGHTDYGSYDDC